VTAKMNQLSPKPVYVCRGETKASPFPVEVFVMRAFQRSVVIFAMFVGILVATSAHARDNSALKKRMEYLRGIEEVSWVEIDNNNVYIGFERRPLDLPAIVNAAAVVGNRALDFGVHVWAVAAEHSGWRPGDAPYYCEATARYGKLKSPCK